MIRKTRMSFAVACLAAAFPLAGIASAAEEKISLDAVSASFAALRMNFQLAAEPAVVVAPGGVGLVAPVLGAEEAQPRLIQVFRRDYRTELEKQCTNPNPAMCTDNGQTSSGGRDN
ncbi:MAG: hypothetical protein HY078_01555 [Elusimicrobia bacterium]|nr:hypothetical protein [Elusimicrobiota bacterium]